MIYPALYKQPVVLDKARHGRLKMQEGRLIDWSRMARLPSCYLHAAEFADACLEFPIVFVRMKPDPRTGQADIGPAAVFGFGEHENLYVDGGRWRAGYVPAHFRAWPFGVQQADDGTTQVVLDESCPGLDEASGTPLYDEDGALSAYTREAVEFVKKIYDETPRTQAFCARLMELDVLQPRRFSADHVPGGAIMADGFWALDERKAGALSDEQVLELHWSGFLGSLHAHHLSLRHMARLVTWRAQRMGGSGQR